MVGEALLDLVDVVLRLLQLVPEQVVLVAGNPDDGLMLLGALAHCCAHCIRSVIGSKSLHGVLDELVARTVTIDVTR